MLGGSAFPCGRMRLRVVVRMCVCALPRCSRVPLWLGVARVNRHRQPLVGCSHACIRTNGLTGGMEQCEDPSNAKAQGVRLLKKMALDPRCGLTVQELLDGDRSWDTFKLQEDGCTLLLPAACCLLPAHSIPLPITLELLFTSHCPLPTACCLIHHPPPTSK